MPSASARAFMVDAARGQFLARFPHYRAGAGPFALPPAVQHRPAGQHNCRDIYRCCRHQTRRRCLVATGHQHYAVEGIPIENFHERQIGKVAIECGGGSLSGLLNRVTGKLECNSAGSENALADAFGELEVMAVAGRKVRAGLRNTDDWLGGAQLRRRKPEIQIALEIERGHSWIFWIVEPKLRPQPTRRFTRNFRHGLPDYALQMPIHDRNVSQTARTQTRRRSE